MTIGERIKIKRNELRLSQRELAKLIGYADHSTITKIEAGKVDLPQSKLSQFAEALHTSVAYLMGWTESVSTLPVGIKNVFPIETKKIPLLGSIACGEPILAAEQFESYVEVGATISADFCLRAQGDSMTGARIFDGDIVFIRSQPMVENGEIAAVIINDEATLKRVYYYPENNEMSLFAENPKYQTMRFCGQELDSIKILGKAIAFQSDVK